MSKVLRLDVNLIFTIINLIVLYLLMKKFLIQPVNGIMEKRKAMIEEQMGRARDSENQAMKLKESYEKIISTAENESDKIIEAAKADAKLERERMLKEANNEAERILTTARNNAKADQEKTLEETRSQIAGLAVLAAEKLLSGGSSQKGNQMLYDQFLAQAGEANDANGS